MARSLQEDPASNGIPFAEVGLGDVHIEEQSRTAGDRRCGRKRDETSDACAESAETPDTLLDGQACGDSRADISNSNVEYECGV